MRISNRAGRLLGCILIVAFLPLTSLFTQEQKLDLRSYLEKATEEIPEQNKSQILAQTNPPTNDEVNAILHNITEDVQDHPKPVFVNGILC